MPTIYIDDQAYEVPEGDNILAACLNAGLDLPYFCWHPEMGSIGACRQCALVQYRDQDDTRGRIVMGCMTPVTDGARFSMQGGNAAEFRENVVESLMLNHPHDCPVCAEGGECHLQDMTVLVGHRNRRYRGKKNTHKNQNLGPLIHHEMNRCITCYRCTRFYSDYAGGKDLSAQAAHDHVYFGRHEDGTLESEFAGNLVEVCPTGVFTDKPLVDEYTRKWDLQSAPSVCTGCAAGCNTIPGERYGKLKRVHNRYNNEVNGYFLCDRGRYGGHYVNEASRPRFAGLKQADGRYNAVQSNIAIDQAVAWFRKGKIAAIGSPRASLESNFLLQELVGNDSFVSGFSDHESQLIGDIINIMQHSAVHTPSTKEVESADAVLILGEDVSNTTPRLALSLRQSVRNRAKQMAAEMRIPEWQDEAVRNLAQHTLSPLYIVGTSESRLDDVAQKTICLAPNDIALFGHAIAANIDPTRKSIELGEILGGNNKHTAEKLDSLAKTIADSLVEANRPLIVSGSGCQSSTVINAAAQIAIALKKKDAMLSYCVAEANSLGLGLLTEKTNRTIASLCDQARAGDLETLIVVENDLYRRAPASHIDQLLQSVANVIVIDVLDSRTLSNSTMALPAASVFESEGTLVSNEGRAQRHYPVFLPSDDRQASWKWLNAVRARIGQSEFSSFDDVTAACATAHDSLSKITAASPSSQHRSRGVKIPRQTHRASGRTAMRANISVHEPKQPTDKESPLAFTMEGDNKQQPGALLPFVWSPGWNSNQSLHKFQSEVGGALSGGTAGVRLIEVASDLADDATDDAPYKGATKIEQQLPEQTKLSNNGWRLAAQYRVFGSDELSAHSPAIDELVEAPFIQLSRTDAERLSIAEGDPISVSFADSKYTMALQINDSLPTGYAGYPTGLPDVAWLPNEVEVQLQKSDAEGD